LRNILLACSLSLSLASPFAAAAQDLQPRAMPPVPSPARSTVWVIQPTQWLIIGVGAVAAVAALEVLAPTRLIYVAGGVAGGYLANILYNGQHVEIRTVP
jgi:sarcosine oxidase gamma subunit